MKQEQTPDKNSELRPEIKSVLYAGTDSLTRAVAESFVEILRTKPTEVVAAYDRKVRSVLFNPKDINHFILGRHLAAEQVLLERVQPYYLSLKK